jgi:hypothetical protein
MKIQTALTLIVLAIQGSGFIYIAYSFKSL